MLQAFNDIKAKNKIEFKKTFRLGQHRDRKKLFQSFEQKLADT